MLKRVALVLALVLVPLVAAVWARPAAAVQLVAGVHCVNDSVCVDDESKLGAADQLYEEAFSFVGRTVSPLHKRPLTVFCASQRCYRSFGFDGSAAQSVGGFVIVVSPRGWKPYYVRHEMIHRLQAQELGAWRMYLLPEWFVEGMAYLLSGDPRADLPEPYQDFRARFEQWYRSEGRRDIWAQARTL